jgi:ketosteroid isomerase-like protein
MSLAVLALFAAGASPADDRAALEEAKLRTWPTLYRTNDADGLANFLADGFVQFSDDGSIETKEQAVAWVRSNKWANANNDFRYEISRIAFYGPDTANVFGVGSYDGKAADGSACRMRYTSSNIFIRDKLRWRPIFSHTTAAACGSKDKS